MAFLFSRNIKSEKKGVIFDKKRFGGALAACILVFSLTISGCQQNQPQDADSAFLTYTKMIFAQEVASNTVSLHYTLKNPEDYGIENVPVTFGTFVADEEVVHVSIENMRKSLSAFSYDDLSVQNQLTYDVIEYYLALIK